MEEEKLSKNSKEFQTLQKEQRDKKIEDRIVKACKAIEQSAIPRFKRDMLAFENKVHPDTKLQKDPNAQQQDGPDYMPSSPPEVASPKSQNQNNGEVGTATFREQAEQQTLGAGPEVGENNLPKEEEVLNKTENEQL